MFIFVHRYLDHSDDDGDDESDDEHKAHDDENLSEDEATVKKMDEFEEKYNYRFEEPDEEFIKRYPRTIKDSMRRQDSSR